VVAFNARGSLFVWEYKFKFVSFGSDISKATAVDAQPSTVSRRPFKIATYTGTKIVNDWVLDWVATNQFDGEEHDAGVDYPDQFGGYLIQVLNPADDVVKRSVTQQQSTYTYTEAQQIADFGIVQGSVKIRVAQIDRIVGPGYYNTKIF